jgi:hypothetical protein
MSILVRRRVTVRAVAVVRLVDQAVQQTAELLRHQFTDQRRSDARTRAGAVASDGAAVIGGRKLPPVRLKRTFYAERPDVPLRRPARPQE